MSSLPASCGAIAPLHHHNTAPAFLSLPPNTFKRVLDDTPLAGTSMEELRANWKQLTVEDIVCLLNSFAKVNAEPEPYFLCLLQNLPPKTFKRVLDDTPLAGTSIEVLQANWKQLKPAVVKRLFNSYVKQTSRNGFQRLLTYFHCGFNKKRNVERESSPPSVIIAEVPVLPTFVGETAILISETDEPVYTDAACEPSDHEHQYPQQEKSSVSLSQVEPPKGDSPVSGIASNDCSFQDISQRITI